MSARWHPVALTRAAYLRLLCPPDPFRFDPRLDAKVSALCLDTPPHRRVVNIGSGRTSYGPRTLNLDIEAFPGVQVRADAQRLPLRDASAAGVLLRGVLEHVRRPAEVRDEALRVLSPGGFVYVEVPFMQPYHRSPEDHRRYTLDGLRSFWSDGTTETEAGVQIGPGSALAWVAREALASVCCLGSSRAYPKVLTIAGWATFWLKYLDKGVRPGPHVAHAASALYYLGQKRA